MTCRFCGNSGEGKPFDKWVKPTFTDHDKLKEGTIICNDCLFWFVESSPELAMIVGKEKPQRMRNYSHFIIGGEWIPCSKGDKRKMVTILTGSPFPELAAIADSGQKHIVFRATRNKPGGTSGWVQFEEQTLWVDPSKLTSLLETVSSALSVFSKTELQSGAYKPHRILKSYGIDQWQKLEDIIKPLRGSLFFELALFLAQPSEDKQNEWNDRNSSRPAGDNLEGGGRGLQEQVSENDMGTIREYSEKQRTHEQPGEVRQLTMFET